MALVTIPQGLWWPYQLSEGLIGAGAVTTMNAATMKTHMFGRVYIAGRATNKTLSAAGGGSITFWSTSVVFANGATTLDIGLQDTSATGNPTRPDGVFDVKRTLTGGIDTINNNNFTTVTMDTGSKTLSHGDLVSVVFDLTGRGGVDTVAVNVYGNTGAFGQTNSNQQHFPGANFFTGGAWSTSGSYVPLMLITFDDGTVGYFDQTAFVGATNSEGYQDATNPDERGLIFQLPFACQFDAFKAYLLSVRSNSNLTFTLYSDPLGTPTSIGSVTETGNHMNTVNFGNGWIGLPLTTPVTLTPNTDYCVALKVNPGDDIALGYSSIANAAHRALFPAGTTIKKATRNNLTGAFTAESPALTMYNMGVRLSAFDIGSAGVTDVNVTHVNGLQVGGSGTAGDPWGPSGAAPPPATNANITQVKGIAITGSGTAGDPWRPA